MKEIDTVAMNEQMLLDAIDIILPAAFVTTSSTLSIMCSICCFSLSS